MIVNDPNPQVKPATTEMLAELAVSLRLWSADPIRLGHERALLAAAAVLVDRAARLRGAGTDVDLAGQVEDALTTAVRVATALGSEA